MNGSNHSDFWDSLYKSNNFHWDLGGSTPVFREMVTRAVLKPGKLLVLGAGRGHDARLFAQSGFEVTAVDFSAEAAEYMRQLDDPDFPVEIVQVDFFSLPSAWNGRYDYVLDYTAFYAIIPQRRSEYADLVTRLLKPGGQYIILAFPIGSRSGGPPFVVQPPEIIELFAERGFILQFQETPAVSATGRASHEELLILEKSSGR